MVRTAALVLALIASAAGAKPVSTVAADIAKAKASMLASADRAHASFYLKNSANFDKMGITATQARAITLWTTMGYSLGICQDFGGEALQAAWLSAADTFSPPPPLRDMGISTLTEGQKREGAVGELTSSEMSKLCRGEMGAVRQILAEKFGVR